MARKNVFLHVGPSLPGTQPLQPAFDKSPELLAIAGLATPQLKPDQMTRAAHEILGDHRAAGLRRADVEGAWAEICRQAYRMPCDVALSQERFSRATPGQIALLLDSLSGMKVQVIALAPASQLDLEDVLAPWAAYLNRDQLHPVRLGRHPSSGDLIDEMVALGLRTRSRELERRLARAQRRSAMTSRGMRVAS